MSQSAIAPNIQKYSSVVVVTCVIRAAVHCDRPHSYSQLLKKDYQTDHYVAKCWKWIQQELIAAYLLTIFGYSAPTTDFEAVQLLQQSWDPDRAQQHKTMEIIDIRSESELSETWRRFFPTSYYMFHRGFEGSLLHRFPRRSCESQFGIELNGFEYAEGICETAIPQAIDWDDLRMTFEPLIQAEKQISREDHA